MTVLPTRTVGRTGHAVTVLAFGGVQVGDHFVKVSEPRAAGAVEAAWDVGIRYFDTAPLYGRGLSEHRIGSVLRHRRRSDFVLSTKIGRLLLPDQGVADDSDRRGLPFRVTFDYGYDSARRSIEQSLHRLGLSRIDFAFIHDLEPRVHGEDFPARFADAVDGGYRALDELRSEGVIGGVGAGLNDAYAAIQLIERTDLDCLLLAGRYTLLEQQPLDDLLPLAVRRGIGIVIGAPFNSGVLATGAVAGAVYGNKPLGPALEAKVRAIEAVCAAHDVPLPAAALQFPLAHPAVVSIVAGMASAEEVRRNVALMERPIPPAFWTALRDEGLVRADAPVPQPAT